MKKETGWITTILMALAAVLGFTALPARKAAESSGNDKTISQGVSHLQPRASRLAAPAEMKDSPCWQIEKSVLIFIGQDDHQTSKFAVPDTCLKPADKGKFKPQGAMETANVRFVVATLPDPVHTHFSLLFDRLTEALQQAAQDQGYNYDSSWLPWAPEGRGSSAQKDGHNDEDQSAQQLQPGVLVFRKSLPSQSEYCPPAAEAPVSSEGSHDAATPASEQTSGCHPPPPYEAGLVFFVVGETPTGGIDPDQLQNAFDWIEVLGGKGAKQKAGMLGPYFSGSLPSLYEGLLTNEILGGANTTVDKGAAAQSDAATPKTFAVFSGSVTSKAGIDWFDAQLANSPARFFSFQQNDDHMIDSYCLYLTNQGYDTGKLAIISEDETAYGFSLPARKPNEGSSPSGNGAAPQKTAGAIWLPDCDNAESRSAANNSGSPASDTSSHAHGPLYVYYPRDIAALRSAYSQQQPSGSQNQNTASPGLPMDLVEPASRERDTISSFGERQTTLSQEATLFGISNLFKAHDIQFIVLRSSNTLDQVFLTRFFSRTYPQARVVLTSADLLFRRSSETAGFRGTMTLTTYPLLTWQQDWTHWQTPQSRHSHRAFPEDMAEGLYLAARFLIGLPEASKHKPGTLDARTIPDASEKGDPLVLKGRSIEIQDYAPPSWLLKRTGDSSDCLDVQPAAKGDRQTANPTRPPIWLSVVGNGQLWPVAVLGDCIPEAKGPYLYPGPVNRVQRSKFAPADTLPWADTDAKAEHLPDFDLPLPMFLACAVILAWSFWHFFCCVFGSHTSSIRLGDRKLSPSSFRSLSYFAPVPRRQHKWLIFIGCLITWLLAVEIAAATGILHRPPYAMEHPLRAIAYCVLLGLLSWGALLANYRTYLLPDWTQDDTCVAAFQNAGTPRYNSPLLRKGALLFGVAAFLVLWVFYGWIVASLGKGAAVFAVWRSINLFTGVSAAVPLILLTAGLYGWFWHSLSGLVLFNAGVPKLPKQAELLPFMPMFSREGPGKRIQDAAIPLKSTYGRHFLIFSLIYIAFWQLAGDATSIRALGPMVFGKIYAVWFGLLIVLTLTESWQMLRTWSQLRELLTYLDRLPLRRTLQALHGISWGTIWKVSGNVLEQRDRMLSRQTESLRHLENELALLRSKSPGTATILPDENITSSPGQPEVPPLYDQLAKCGLARDAFVQWFASNYEGSQYGPVASGTVQSDLSAVAAFQKELATTAGVVLNRILLPAWRHETSSLILDSSGDDKEKKSASTLPKDDYVRAAEEFFCLPYLGFIQNILGRIRTMTFAIICLFVGATLSVASYPFDPRPVMSGIFVVVFFTVAAVMTFVYAEMHRDPTLSHITNTNPGELGSDFWMKIITFGIGPFLGLMTALFPDIAGFLTSWIQPAVGSIR